MKKVHIISIGDSRLCDLAIAFASKGHQVTCSGMDIMEPERSKLIAHDLLPKQEGWYPEVLDKEYDYVIPANNLSLDNPELLRAKELNLLVLSFPEYVFSRFKNKSRILVSGSLDQDSIIRMMHHALRANQMIFDYVYSETIDQDPAISWGYDARMAILQEDPTFSPFIKKQINEYYRPHLLIISSLNEMSGLNGLEGEERRESLMNLLNSIERDGKFIYNQNDPELCALAEQVREDVTALPYTQHAVAEEGPVRLVSRFGEYPLGHSNERFLSNLNAARIACRQMGLQDKDFYESISQYSHSLV